MSIQCQEIQDYIDQTEKNNSVSEKSNIIDDISEWNQSNESNQPNQLDQLEFKFQNPQLFLRIWSLKVDRVNHDNLAQYVIDAMQQIRTLKWSTYNPKQKWSMNLKLTP